MLLDHMLPKVKVYVIKSLIVKTKLVLYLRTLRILKIGKCKCTLIINLISCLFLGRYNIFPSG